MSLRVGAPSFAGTLPLQVGKRRFGIPPGSRVAHVQGHRIAYVVTPDRQLHAFTSSGEVYGIPEPLAALVRSRYFSAPDGNPGLEHEKT